MPDPIELCRQSGLTPELIAETMAAGGVEWVREQLAKEDFGEWLRVVSPKWHWEWPHLAKMREYLEKVGTREIRRLIIVTQPQVGKTEQNTVRFPAWLFERDPTERQAVACYDQHHANRISRRMRRICRKRQVPLSKERASVSEWETKAGGYLRAIGIGTGIMGTALDRGHIDDPIKGFEEANSPAYRERLWGWFNEDFMTRLQKNATVTITMTLWHDDDLVGRILNSANAKRWVMLRLPAEAEEDDAIGRQPGELLCPDRFDRDSIDERKESLGLGYYGLYQCRPVPRGGAMFRKEWFDASWVLAAQIPIITQLVRYWDLAASLKGDWTVGILMGRGENGLFYILDMVRGRWLPAERDRTIRDTAETDGVHVRIGFGKDPGQAGVDQMAGLVRHLAGFQAEGTRESGSKETRADAFASQFGAGNVRIVRAAWAEVLEKELLSFPGGKYDDIVDSLAGGFRALLTNRSVYEDRGILFLDSRRTKELAGVDPWDDRMWS